MFILIICVLVALVVSFMCSLFEATLLSLTPTQIADMSAKHPKTAMALQHFKDNIERPISVILILNTASNTIGAAIAATQFNLLYGNKWIWGFSFCFTYLMLQFAEIFPKSIGVRFNRELAPIIVRPLQLAIAAFSPIVKFVNLINRPFERKGDKNKIATTVEEISTLAGLARLSNQIGAHQERIIKGASRLSRLHLDQVMIPVEQISFLSTSQSLPEAVIAAHIDTHTRFPVREGNDSNNVVGYVNFKEMIYFMRTNPNEPNFRGIIRPLHFASPNETASDLMKLFVGQHVHMAIIHDDNGKTLGLVTLEDLVEELVGELEDEFDRLPRMFHSLPGNVWMVGGGIPMTEIVQKLQLPIQPTTENFAAWIASKIGTHPKAGDYIREPYTEFLVRRVRRGKVFEVAVTKIQ